MATLEQTQKELQKASGLMKGYSADLPGEINKQIKKAWSKPIQQATKDVQTELSQFLPTVWGAPEAGMMKGTGAESVSPQYKLQQMGKEASSALGRIDYATRYADYMGAQAENWYQKALDAANAGQEAAARLYENKFREYQLAWQEAEAEKDRQFQAQQSALNRGGGGGVNPWGDQTQFGTAQGSPRDEAYLKRMQDYFQSGDFEGMASTLERWGAEISPQGYNAMSPEWREYFDNLWKVTQEGRFGNKRNAWNLGQNYLTQQTNLLGY